MIIIDNKVWIKHAKSIILVTNEFSYYSLWFYVSNDNP